MAYRNKTYVAFDSADIHYYRLMEAWRDNTRIEFNFYDAHDLNTARDSSSISTIERRLSERLANTKQVVLLVGEGTRRKADDGHSFLHHEVSVIRRLGLPVVFANLNKSREAEAHRLPSALAKQYSISVSFQPSIIKYALDNFVEQFSVASANTSQVPHHYKASVYSQLGL